MAAAAILDNFEWPYLRNGSRSTYIARIERSSQIQTSVKMELKSQSVPITWPVIVSTFVTRSQAVARIADRTAATAK